VSVPSPIRAEPPDHHSSIVLTFPASVGMIQAFHEGSKPYGTDAYHRAGRAGSP